MGTWDNMDGLKVKFGLDRAAKNPKGANAVQATHHMTVDIDFVNGKHSLSDVSKWDAQIPAGSYITRATLTVTEAIAGAGTETVDIGLAEPDQTVIDSDGIDSAIAFSALGANKAVDCDGALVGGTATIGANAGVVYVTPSANTLTAGKAVLTIEYVTV